ncbi:tubulin polyglutamylase TTLL11 [Chanos chanos]|uniref:Tubulin polyglutamylase TTLL11 n=1 Tax=Chanos chanos TaxID=29144 RepID=A0A6J2VXP7_CHACN|nr:tubulin polyglutamylase TTLL11 [Chanos chanos]
MSDHYEIVKTELEQMKSSGDGLETEAAADEDQLSPVSQPARVSPIPAAVTLTVRRDASKSSVNTRNRSKSRGKLSNQDRSPNEKRDSDVTPHGSRECVPGKGLGRIGSEQILQIKGTGKILQGKTETNGNNVPNQKQREGKFVLGKGDGNKVAKKKPVTVDTSKAKTSLEALKLSIRQLKWKEVSVSRRSACDIYWHGVSFHDNENIISGQVNKFPGMIEMLRKINLSRAVRTMQQLFPDDYNFYPRSWIMPEEYQLFSTQVRLMKELDPTLKPTFIVKPDSGSQGDGIYLIREPAELRVLSGCQLKQAVVQEYIQKPLLIDKLKFDIRLYVLIRSLEPLEIYIAKEGLSRFCTEPYQEPSQQNLSHVFMHLTNYSLNVQSGNFVHSDSFSTGSKRTFSSVLYRVASKGVDIKKVWSDIIALVIKTVIALVPELKVYYQADIPPGKPGPTCFQILGFDILLMKNLKPVLLEVNANPSMRIEHEQEVSPGVFQYVPSPVDEEVKVGVIRDTLRLVDPALRKKYTGSPEEEIQVEAELVEKAESAGVLPSLCLKQVFPKYTKQFHSLRIVERIAAIFLRFLGVKGTMKLGPTGFRTFIRNCKLTNGGFSMASVDILYIDITRRWASAVPDSREAGMCLQAFVEAFFYLASRRFKALSLREQVLSLLDICETAIQKHGQEDKPRPQKHHTNVNPTHNAAPPPLDSPADGCGHHHYHDERVRRGLDTPSPDSGRGRRKLCKDSAAFRRKLCEDSAAFRRKLCEDSAAFRRKLCKDSAAFRRKLCKDSAAFRRKLCKDSAAFRRKLCEDSAAFRRKLCKDSAAFRQTSVISRMPMELYSGNVIVLACSAEQRM